MRRSASNGHGLSPKDTISRRLASLVLTTLVWATPTEIVLTPSFLEYVLLSTYPAGWNLGCLTGACKLRFNQTPAIHLVVNRPLYSLFSSENWTVIAETIEIGNFRVRFGGGDKVCYANGLKLSPHLESAL
jgi:hypothetical protein